MVKAKAKQRNRSRAERRGEKADLTEADKQRQREDDIATVVSMSKTNPWDVRSEVFKDLEVGSAIVMERLENFDDTDARTVITSKSFKGLNIRKKDKRKIKKHIFNAKLALVQEAKRQKAEARKNKKKRKGQKAERQQTEVTGDLLPLLESLPSVQQYVEKCQTQHKPQPRVEPKSKGRPKAKQFQRMAMEDTKLFKRVLAVPEFKTAPGKAIQTHLDNKIALENRKYNTKNKNRSASTMDTS